MVNPPHINDPVLLHYDSDTTLYNISWNCNPPEDAIDIDHYEINIGSLNRSTNDTYMVVEIMSNVDVAINVTVVDRCNRHQSTAKSFPPEIPVGKIKLMQCRDIMPYIYQVYIHL